MIRRFASAVRPTRGSWRKGAVWLTCALAVLTGAALTSCEKNRSCDKGEMCLWRNDGRSPDATYMVDFKPYTDLNYTTGGPYWAGTSIGINDSVSSFRNRSYSTFLFTQESNPFIDEGFSGNCFIVGSGGYADDLSDFNDIGTWNPEDSFSGHSIRQNDIGQAGLYCEYEVD